LPISFPFSVYFAARLYACFNLPFSLVLGGAGRAGADLAGISALALFDAARHKFGGGVVVVVVVGWWCCLFVCRCGGFWTEGFYVLEPDWLWY
jgi:hypothetical protein